MVLQCAYIKALRTGRLVYNGGLRLVKPTRRKCFSRKAFIHRFAHTFRLPAFYSGGEARDLVNPRPRGPVPAAPAEVGVAPG